MECKDPAKGASSLDQPSLVVALHGVKITAVACGAAHSLCIDAAGGVWAWGDNRHGQLGIGEAETGRSLCTANPRSIEGLRTDPASRVACGDYHSLAVTSSGSVFTWGGGSFGVLGTGDAPRRGSSNSSGPQEGVQQLERTAGVCKIPGNTGIDRKPRLQGDDKAMCGVIEAACGGYH
ncbi:regulator of chromosome condensation 1/beta-lactamase-inhibitor protein II [Baffinella frigidus]|nr:regulator of chromosome condensation 1/beta-lactamase-inhibitor protein II [Cryptophyta sp. CCMP2293]